MEQRPRRGAHKTHDAHARLLRLLHLHVGSAQELRLPCVGCLHGQHARAPLRRIHREYVFSGMRSTVCSTRVDFPMPGSPPIKTRDPCTRPPPSTRFSSASWRSMRGSSSATISWRLRVWLWRSLYPIRDVCSPLLSVPPLPHTCSTFRTTDTCLPIWESLVRSCCIHKPSSL